MPHYDELYPGRFLKGTTLERPLTIRILSLGGERLQGDDGEKAKGILKYRATSGDGEIVFAKTNAILTAAILGPDYTKWTGHLVTIEHDPNVMFGAEKVGGIRVCGSPELTRVLKVEVKRPRRKKVETYTLYPTDNKGQRRAPAQRGAAPAPQSPPDDMPPPDEREVGADDESGMVP